MNFLSFHKLGTFYQQIKKFNVINEYGTTFRRMRNERYEIIYEHSDDLEGPWHEYDFLYKPSNVNSTLPFPGEFKLFLTEYFSPKIKNHSFQDHTYRVLTSNYTKLLLRIIVKKCGQCPWPIAYCKEIRMC